VLVLDTARFKYPPFWVELEKLYDSINSIDNETGKMRGLVVLGKKKQVNKELLGQLNEFGEREIGISLKDIVPSGAIFKNTKELSEETLSAILSELNNDEVR
jgi:glutathione gamma-glutamylcysteinyltransferase